MTKRLPLATLLGVFVLLVLGGNTVLAGPPPAYVVYESKLPFDALPGTSTTRYWGVHGGTGTGYKIESPTIGTAISCSMPTASAAPAST
jgi:hypothetical protein